MSNKVILLNPVSDVEALEVQPRRFRERGLKGARLGVLTNMFRGEDLPGAVAEELQREFDLSIARYVKPSLSHVSDDAVIEKMARDVDCVVVGMCG